jgi:hypothetical protein
MATVFSLGHDGWVREVQVIAEEATACADVARALADALDTPGLPATPARLSDGFTPEQLSRPISPRYPLAADGMTPARLVPLLERDIRRVPNPRYERRFATDGEVATELLFARVLRSEKGRVARPLLPAIKAKQRASLLRHPDRGVRMRAHTSLANLPDDPAAV